MKKKIFFTFLLITSTILFSACGKTQTDPIGANKFMDKEMESVNADISEEDDLATIEKELDETVILEEDFGDLDE